MLQTSIIIKVYTKHNFYLFIFKRGVGEGQRERNRILSKLHGQHRAQHGAWSHDSDTMTGAEIKSLDA